jgi:hypothetical protein
VQVPEELAPDTFLLARVPNGVHVSLIVPSRAARFGRARYGEEFDVEERAIEVEDRGNDVRDGEVLFQLLFVYGSGPG